jgi:hypothetical protein
MDTPSTPRWEHSLVDFWSTGSNSVYLLRLSVP